MKLTTTAKLKIVPDKSDVQLLIDTMHAYTRGCDYVSEYIFTTHNFKQAEVNKAVYGELRTVYGLRSQMAQSVIKTVIARYKTILGNKHKWIRLSFRKPQYDLVWNRDYSLTKGKFSVNTLEGRIKVPFYAKGVDTDGKFGTAKLVYKHGKFFLHVPVTKEIDSLSLNDVINVVGVDRGIRFPVTAYDSQGKTTFYSGKDIKEKRAHYALLRKQLQQVGTPSSRRRLKAIGRRENRFVNDVNHCISKALTANNPDGTLFVLEDLAGIRKAAERVCANNRHIQVSWPYYNLEQKIIYKAHRNHQEVVKVDPKYTSQTCPKCGHVSKRNRDKKNHIFHCENCGYESNDDRIGAMNLHRMGIEYLVQSCESTPLTSGAQSIVPMM